MTQPGKTSGFYVIGPGSGGGCLGGSCLQLSCLQFIVWVYSQKKKYHEKQKIRQVVPKKYLFQFFFKINSGSDSDSDYKSDSGTAPWDH